MTAEQQPLLTPKRRRAKPQPTPDTRPRCEGCGTTWIEPALRRVNRRKTGYDTSAWCKDCHKGLTGEEAGMTAGSILMTPRAQP
jgi:hypothetical protein